MLSLVFVMMRECDLKDKFLQGWVRNFSLSLSKRERQGDKEGEERKKWAIINTAIKV